MLIQVIEKAETALGQFQIELWIGNQKFEVLINNPHTPKVEQNLEWYFEEYLNEPYTASTRVQRERQRIVDYGKELFTQLFADPVAEAAYRQALHAESFDHLVFEISSSESSIAFQGILWETLRDPEFIDEPLVAKGVAFFRKSVKKALLPSNVNEHPEINLLIVSARPSEENDVDYRTVQRPIIDLIYRKSNLRVKPFILRPGTFKALKEHLASVKSGFYHIVHFDLHGEVMTFADLDRERTKGNYRFAYAYQSGKQPIAYNVRYGDFDIEAFDGLRAFLFFESEEKGKAEPYFAETVASLLRDYRIPICILNACQSAKQEGISSETSLAKFLQEQGVDLVLAMRYSVSVSAVVKFMERFYSELFNERSIDDAIAIARMSLYNEKTRKANLGYEIDLEDWVLPVIYKRQEVIFSLRERSEEEKEAYFAERKKLTPFPRFTYGFVGRDLDILKIEKMLLPPHNHLLVRGMLGVGKSTLLAYLAAWWTVTNFRGIHNAFRFDFRQQNFNYELWVKMLVERIWNPEQLQKWGDRSSSFLEGEVLDELNRRPYALILDNIFQLTDSALLDFLGRIQGASFVVYGSVNPEVILAKSTFGDHIYQLDGLDGPAASELANLILEKTAGKSLTALMAEDQFSTEHLLRLLAGFPMALEAVLPNLKNHSAKEVLQKFQSGELVLYDSSLPSQAS